MVVLWPLAASQNSEKLVVSAGGRTRRDREDGGMGGDGLEEVDGCVPSGGNGC